MSKTNPEVTVIVTILNEAKTIIDLLDSLRAQTYSPTEIILTDGGSTDGTLEILEKYKKTYSKFPLMILEKKGNRSIGRNYAIQKAKTDLIAITDAGCIPKESWLEELVIKYKDAKAPVIAGYYQGKAKTAFEEAVIPYVLVMPDRVDEQNFLPATRSMLLEKKVWKMLNGFNENLSDNEDYDFAKRIIKNKFEIVFARKAMVTWIPRSNLKDFFWMIFRFARGDIKAGIVRPKVIGLFVRYFLALIFISTMLILFNPAVLINFLIISTGIYSLWAIHKNHRYTERGWYWLPVLQFTADFAVMSGSVSGSYQK